METDDYFPCENLLEVVVEEEESELSVPNNADSDQFELPPIPRFDLQSTQFSNIAYLPAPLPPALPIVQQPKKIVPATAARPPPATKGFKSPPNLKEVKQQLLSSFESTRMVLDKADKYPKDLTLQSGDEMSFYHTVFKDTSNVAVCRLHCTICDKHIGCGSPSVSKVRSHRMLGVLICNECFDFYGDGKFPLDTSDDTEIYCRWCGQGGDLVCCSFCPKVFCNKCVKRNFDSLFLKQIQKSEEWACFCCAQIPLWPLRAVCRALLLHNAQGTAASEDITNCCKKPIINAKSKKIAAPRSLGDAPVSNPMVVFQPGMFPSTSKATKPPYYYRAPAPPKPVGLSLLKPRPPAVPQRPAAPQVPMQRSRAGRPIRVMTPLPNSPPKSTAQSNANSKPVLPLNMPKVRIDHSTLDTTVVRLRLSNNKEQYLRVNVVGSCQRMPRFPANASITLTTISHAFRANKMAFEKLLGLKDKVEANKMGNIFEEATAIKSMLEKWQELITIIDNDLAENLKLEEEKLKSQTSDVIELSDDDEDIVRKPVWNFLNWKNFSGDSEIEIIDDDDDEAPEPSPSKKRKFVGDSDSAAKRACLSNGDVDTTPTGGKRNHSNIKLVDDDAETETDEEMEEEEKTDASLKPDEEGVDKSNDTAEKVGDGNTSGAETNNENKEGLQMPEKIQSVSPSTTPRQCDDENGETSPSESERAVTSKDNNADENVLKVETSDGSPMPEISKSVRSSLPLGESGDENVETFVSESDSDLSRKENNLDVSSDSEIKNENDPIVDAKSEQEEKVAKKPSSVDNEVDTAPDTSLAHVADKNVLDKLPGNDGTAMKCDAAPKSLENNSTVVSISEDDEEVKDSHRNILETDPDVSAISCETNCIGPTENNCVEKENQPADAKTVARENKNKIDGLETESVSIDIEKELDVKAAKGQDDLLEGDKVGEDEKMDVDDADLEASLCAEDGKDGLDEDIDEDALLNDG